MEKIAFEFVLVNSFADLSANFSTFLLFKRIESFKLSFFFYFFKKRILLFVTEINFSVITLESI